MTCEQLPHFLMWSGIHLRRRKMVQWNGFPNSVETCISFMDIYLTEGHKKKHRMTGRIQIGILGQHIFGLSKRSWDVGNLLTDCWNWWWFSHGPYPIVFIPLVMSTSGHLYHDFVYVFCLVGNSCFFVLVPSRIYKTSVCLLRNTNNNNDKTRTKYESGWFIYSWR